MRVLFGVLLLSDACDVGDIVRGLSFADQSSTNRYIYGARRSGNDADELLSADRPQ